MVKYYTGNIVPEPNTIFVFGSNPEGRHGKGSAYAARTQFGAVYGQGEGLQGKSYGIPTIDLRIRGKRNISKKNITISIKEMYKVAEDNPSLNFKVAYRNIDTVSLSGYSGIETLNMFLDAGEIPDNVYFSEEWYKYLMKL